MFGLSSAITGVFVDRDTTAPDRYFAPEYVQRNLGIPTGRNALRGLISALLDNFSYEMGMVIAEGDLVMIHGRYAGWRPQPMIAVDIFRVADGLLAEHWDVIQDEVPASATVSATVSGNAMFTPTV